MTKNKRNKLVALAATYQRAYTNLAKLEREAHELSKRLAHAQQVSERNYRALCAASYGLSYRRILAIHHEANRGQAKARS